MRKTFPIVLLFAMNAMAADLTGRWSGSFKVNGADHEVPQLFILKQDGKKLTGTADPTRANSIQ